MESKCETLPIKLAHISKEIGAIGKTGQNSGYGEVYNFIEYGVVAGKLRELFDKYKIIIFPTIESYQVSEVVSSKGKAGYHYLLNMAFDVINGEKQEEHYICKWLGEATDYGDKGVNKAITAATKYFIMRLLQISEKGDEDPDSQTPEERRKTPPKEKYSFDFKEFRTKIKNATTETELTKLYIECPDKSRQYFVEDFKKRKAEING